MFLSANLGEEAASQLSALALVPQIADAVGVPLSPQAESLTDDGLRLPLQSVLQGSKSGPPSSSVQRR